MRIFSTLIKVAAACTLFYAGTTAVSQAASYKNLVSKGYKTGALTKSASGGLGWIVSDGSENYFCKLKASMAYVSKTKMVSFTSSGRQVPMDRKVFEAGMGGKNVYIPNLADLKAGRLQPADVGRCRRM